MRNRPPGRRRRLHRPTPSRPLMLNVVHPLDWCPNNMDDPGSQAIEITGGLRNNCRAVSSQSGKICNGGHRRRHPSIRCRRIRQASSCQYIKRSVPQCHRILPARPTRHMSSTAAHWTTTAAAKRPRRHICNGAVYNANACVEIALASPCEAVAPARSTSSCGHSRGIGLLGSEY